ncbi:hypothetical protein [Blastococcus brunescens]|uniref:Uncharacterized protein n=1 Tax=Blastococcus brunescens TaxID=1564165 RepID=A0ABZ1B523_9ACTN|nr:hypothetical protein [Blastococcus sp. BMG 8361]WRL64120.1 hypothetical protein U6N30_31890 [Blastococcus sp. BMG 8361]
MSQAGRCEPGVLDPLVGLRDGGWLSLWRPVLEKRNSTVPRPGEQAHLLLPLTTSDPTFVITAGDAGRSEAEEP